VQNIEQQTQERGFADRFLSRQQKQKTYLGQEKKRVEEITVSQARNLAKADGSPAAPSAEVMAEAEEAPRWADKEARGAREETSRRSSPRISSGSVGSTGVVPAGGIKLQAEVDPMQSVFLDGDEIFLFRRIMIGNRIFRQGFVLRPRPFLEHLADAHFAGQPMSRFTELRLTVAENRGEALSARFGVAIDTPRFVVDRGFPRPFSFIRATLTCETIPPSGGRSTLRVMIGVLSGIILLGLFAIYQSARVVVDLSERRSRFVSSVTHELKTPLTSIRMYIEMLEQGMARTPEREADYYRILGSETARLSRLINNVLEFSKLEKKQFRLEPVEGDFREVIDEVRRVMEAKLKKEGFELVVDCPESERFVYDREVMIQVLINLMENSMKFGRDGGDRRIVLWVRAEDGRMVVQVSDRGPGIPRHALKRVFDDFYRVDNERTRNTRGTGIGLAFVKKVIALSGGTVRARNNRDGPGCTIELSLPLPPSAQAAAPSSRRERR
jgi:signal transduction histidine kinase